MADTEIDCRRRELALLDENAKLRADLANALARRVERRAFNRDRGWKNSRDLQAVLDSNGIFRAANEAWTSMLGWRPEEVVGRSHLEFLHADARVSISRAEGGASDLPGHENRIRHKDGSYRWISWVAGPEGDFVYASGRNITAEKEAAAALEATQAQLRHSQKMEAVGQLTGGLAHDFNNLLAGIIGSLDLIENRVAQGRFADVGRYLASAHGAAKRAAALTHRLLTFARRQALDPRPTDINRLIVGMEEFIRRSIGPGVELRVIARSGLWAASVDPNQLDSALLNLCINGRDAMPNGGLLTIEASNESLEEAAARERDLEPGQYVMVCVSDSGCGMTRHIAAHAFDPFFTTKPLGLGTGLGLSMVYGFARQSGGQVHIHSEPDIGTAIRIYLPRHHGEAYAEANPAGEEHSPRAERGETVLVVDDEPAVRMLVTEQLEELGYVAIEAADGAGALCALRSDAHIDLLITDVGLPGGMNGKQLADAGRELRTDLKVLFITGYSESTVMRDGRLDQGTCVLTKPFAMDALAMSVKDLIAAN